MFGLWSHCKAHQVPMNSSKPTLTQVALGLPQWVEGLEGKQKVSVVKMQGIYTNMNG